MELKDKIVVITGAGSGIGRALAHRFHAEGARKLVLADINGDNVEKVAAEVDGIAKTVDVSREAEIVTLVETTEADIGPIDLFCSNAGISGACDLSRPSEDWQRVWEINVMSHVHAARALVPRMVARGGGYLLNTASAAGLLNQIGSAYYGVTKHASIGFGEWVALSHAHEGIKVSMLCPQAVRTAMTDNTGSGTAAASVDGMMEPEELADVVVEGLREETFLILPHPQVLEYMRRKTSDYDRWIGGMNRLHQKITG
ncbi:SDR family oxidoreductase [Salinisphaera aquimarina]|uniref:SDR family oxidoreductase n=1 Tax=Salinisphaera aquimarina TaxID=2094031 RepID=A0ABV7EWZ7_9GAMM